MFGENGHDIVFNAKLIRANLAARVLDAFPEVPKSGALDGQAFGVDAEMLRRVRNENSQSIKFQAASPEGVRLAFSPFGRISTSLDQGVDPTPELL